MHRKKGFEAVPDLVERQRCRSDVGVSIYEVQQAQLRRGMAD